MKLSILLKRSIVILMTIGFVLMFNYRVLGASIHEIGGLIVLALFLIHFILNWRWVLNVTRNMFKKKTKVKTRIGYVIDILLLICVILIAISGIFTSKIIFTAIRSNSMIWKTIHTTAGCTALVLSGLHLGLHWSSIRNRMKRIIKNRWLERIIVSILCIMSVAGGIYGFTSTDFIRNLSPISSGSRSMQMFRENMEIPENGDMPERPDMGESGSFSGEMPEGMPDMPDEMPEGMPERGSDENFSGTRPNGGMTRPGGNSGSFSALSICSALFANMGILGLFTIIAAFFDYILLGRKKTKMND